MKKVKTAQQEMIILGVIDKQLMPTRLGQLISLTNLSMREAKLLIFGLLFDLKDEVLTIMSFKYNPEIVKQAL